MATKQAGKAVTAARGANVVLASGDLSAATVLDLFQSGDVERVRITVTPADPNEVQERIMARKLAATTPEQAFGGGDATSSKDYVGRPFYLTSVEWQASDIEGGEGLPFYAVLHAVDVDGQVIVLTSGAKSVVFGAALAVDRGWLPRWYKFTMTKTSGGFDAVDLAVAAESETPFDR